MKRRHKLELLLGDIRTLLKDPAGNPKDYALPQAVWGLAFFRERLARDAAATRAVLEVTCLVPASDRSGRQVAEEKLISEFEALDRLDDWKSRH